ncbi:hypothetical protein PSTT_01073 [Puccinia striiformis]|uniref:ATPase F1/V1/A1 complex alpha/beta subunit N-terminal domain-containing protein n=1 Tax=Puccinia striiformis TaxID=27350 RepID=A0A2S4W4T7_9BASI|nr:hypothetical protein PSTT_01073 [Puccinia striiformis]
MARPCHQKIKTSVPSPQHPSTSNQSPKSASKGINNHHHKHNVHYLQVFTIRDAVAQVYGLQDVQADEMVEFISGFRGEGDTIKQPGLIDHVPVGPQLSGRVVDALGNPIDGKGLIVCEEHCRGLQSSTTHESAKQPFTIFDSDENGDISRTEGKNEIFRAHKERRALENSLQDVGHAIASLIVRIDYPKALTSVSTVGILAAFISKEIAGNKFDAIIMFTDVMVPIGHGQRELIIGDRQAGETAVALDPILNQKRWNDRTN